MCSKEIKFLEWNPEISSCEVWVSSAVLTKGDDMNPGNLGEEVIKKGRIWSSFYLELFYIWGYLYPNKDNTCNFNV